MFSIKLLQKKVRKSATLQGPKGPTPHAEGLQDRLWSAAGCAAAPASPCSARTCRGSSAFPWRGSWPAWRWRCSGTPVWWSPACPPLSSPPRGWCASAWWTCSSRSRPCLQTAQWDLLNPLLSPASLPHSTVPGKTTTECRTESSGLSSQCFLGKFLLTCEELHILIGLI